MVQRNIRWGVLGPGTVAEMFGKGINQVSRAELFGVASRSRERAEKFAKKYRAATIYNSYQEMVNSPEIDVVYIATPHRYHFEQSKMCLEAGKHVLCEKPITVNARQADSLFTFAKQRDLFLMEAMWTYFLPIYQQVRQWLDAGEIGEVRLIQSSFGLRINRDVESRIFNPDLAAGVLLDMGIYNLAISQWVMRQEVKSFQVSGVVGETGIDELVAGSITFAGGAIAQFSCNLLSNTSNDLIIYGTRGHIQLAPVFWAATKATLVVNGIEKIVNKPLKASGFEYEIDEATRCIRAGMMESPVHPHYQNLNTMKLLDAMREKLGVVYPFE